MCYINTVNNNNNNTVGSKINKTNIEKIFFQILFTRTSNENVIVFNMKLQDEPNVLLVDLKFNKLQAGFFLFSVLHKPTFEIKFYLF